MRSLQLLSGQNPAYVSYLCDSLNVDNAKTKKRETANHQLHTGLGGEE